MIATTIGRCDLGRFGAEIFLPLPRQADLMIVSGALMVSLPMIMQDELKSDSAQG